MIVGDVGSVLETVRPWLTPFFLLGILGVSSRHYLANKRIDVAAEGSVRDAYAAAVRGFREEVSALKVEHKRDLDEMRLRNSECDEDRDLLRERVSAVREYAEGLYRIILQNSASGVLALGDFPPDDIKHAGERVESLFKRRLHVDDKPSG